ncbi:PspA/IM30 family protein [Methylobacterium sp. 77]|uniref:PspA/IM30 family protein n=1 Tax=Methylobacterium sp. 77 TaxID=1101192 RepID=UPI000360085D|nr:PspA/IM30 family protein [Methylobacterium sp. 77]
MLKLFRLLARGAAARAEEEVIDRHALLILDQQIRETRVSLERSRLALASAVAGDKAEERRLSQVEARSADLEERALAALAAGRDELAAEAADAIAELEAERDAIGEARLRFAREVARIRAVVADATRRQNELERGRRIAAAAEAARRLGIQAHANDRATLKEAEATLSRLRALQAEAADTEAALAEMEPGLSVAERLEREGFGSSTRPSGGAVLERLRSKLRTDAAA